jgi:hypothetical protein
VEWRLYSEALVLCIVVALVDSGDADLLIVEVDRLGRQVVLDRLGNSDSDRIPDVDSGPELVHHWTVVDLRALPRSLPDPRWVRQRCCRPWLRKKYRKRRTKGITSTGDPMSGYQVWKFPKDEVSVVDIAWW